MQEYLPIDGLAPYITGAQRLLFGANCQAVKDGRIASVQTISGTGSLRVGFEFLGQFLPKTVLISNPTWLNHKSIVEKANLKWVEYPYYCPKTHGVNIKGLLETLEKAPAGSIVLLHACAHNPTGVDPTQAEWKQIAEVMKKNSLFPYFDSAYQGFASGDLDKDAWAIRYFLEQGFQMLVSQSFAKNMGLYGERIGALHIVCTNKDVRDKVLSQVRPIIRANYSNPPLHGARIAEKVLNDKANFEAWRSELKAVAERIILMRTTLRKKLEDLKTPGISISKLGTWNHITDQIGMFSYTGLSEKACDILIKKYHIYLLRSGRISMAGINTKNVNYLAESIKAAINEAK
jgi:aspartate aminotransferase